MTRYLVRRLIWGLLVLLCVSIIAFIVPHLTGDPTALYVGMEGGEEDYEAVRHALGFDQPLYEQYWHFISNAVQGDFGRSLRHRRLALRPLK